MARKCDEWRHARLEIRFPVDWQAPLAARAERLGKSVTDYVRELILKEVVLEHAQDEGAVKFWARNMRKNSKGKEIE